jgi:AcrR family transcriptional regulator
MPRPKTLPDRDVLEAAYKLMHESGPDSLTFSLLAQASGLSASTLVQRFRSKAQLVHSTLSFAWDRLDEKTAALAAKVPKDAEGAIQLLTALSKDYGGIEAYADALLILREDLRNPALRSRGASWKAALSRALDDCLAEVPHAPRGTGLLMASQWQGSLLWWSFDPQGAVEDYVEDNLRHFVAAAIGSEAAGLRRRSGRAKDPARTNATRGRTGPATKGGRP